MSGASPPAARTLKVWDPLVRILHWTLVLSVLAAWLTRHGGGRSHEWLGYAALACVGVRLVWGFTGPARARFAGFVRGPSATLAYAAQVARRSEPRHLGHNPLGAWMILALLGMAAATGLSGWVYTTDAYWGEAWLEELHEQLSNGLLALAALHVAGVVFASRRHADNLVAAMVDGRKRPPAPGDLD